MSARAERFSIVGAGLSGPLLACYLGKAGYTVDLYEKRPDPRGGSAGAGKSINLALSERGLHALDGVGLKERVLKDAIPMRGRMIHSETGKLRFQPYGKDKSEVIHSVSREGLNCALLDAAEGYDSVTLFFNKKCVDADVGTGVARFQGASGSGNTRSEQGVLIGADGAFSAVRRAMRRLDGFTDTEDFLEHGYKELTIPPAPSGGFLMEKNALHIWPRGRLMMIALPNKDGSFTVTLFWPLKGPESFAAIKSDEDVAGFFEKNFPDALPLLPRLLEDYRENPVGKLVTIRSDPWHHRGKVILLGDACHAVVPFYGQGMNASFEDCALLSACLNDEENIEKAFRRYQTNRKRHLDALADLAIANFIEMRDHTASPVFLLKKTAERVLARTLPGWFFPLYSMVSFTRVPYADAVERSERQNRIIRNVALAAAAIAGLLARRYLR